MGLRAPVPLIAKQKGAILPLQPVLITQRDSFRPLKTQTCAFTTGEVLRIDGGNRLTLERLRVGAFCVLHHNVLVFDPA